MCSGSALDCKRVTVGVSVATAQTYRFQLQIVADPDQLDQRVNDPPGRDCALTQSFS